MSRTGSKWSDAASCKKTTTKTTTKGGAASSAVRVTTVGSLESLRQMLLSAQRSPTFLAGVLTNNYKGEQNPAHVSRYGKVVFGKVLLKLVKGKVAQQPLHHRVAFGRAASRPLQQRIAIPGR